MNASTRKSDVMLQRRTKSSQIQGWQVDFRSYAWSPPTDVFETATTYIVRIELAGMRDADIHVEVNEHLLRVTGTRVDPHECRSYHQMEIRFGEFDTSIDLPSSVDTQQANAAYDDGFLTIIFPKK